uniref:Amine oxidase n=1 Tax=Eptatretus burgeri TaxID=7764 RepID=A0A8C4NH99_EPTBU
MKKEEASIMAENTKRWKVIAILLFLLNLVFIAILIGQRANRKSTYCFSKVHMQFEPPDTRAAELFSDLTPEEINKVKEYMFSKKQLNLVPITQATVNSNYIFLIELFNPHKEAVLNYLESNGPKPERVARVVIFQGASSLPDVEEYLVGFLPEITWYIIHRPFNRKRPDMFNSRPRSIPEIYHLHTVMMPQIGDELYRILKESYGYWMNNCSTKCLLTVDLSPKGFESGDRESWILFNRYLEGLYVHPVSLEVLVDHRNANTSEWKIKKVYYNGQYFDSIEQFVSGYDKGTIRKVILPKLEKEDLIFSTFKQRGTFEANTKQRGPLEFEPDGQRFQLYGNLVQYMPWTFAFRVRSSTGLQIFDIRFNGERIAYELSFQEAISFYGGNTPAGTQVKAIDNGWLFGSKTFELLKSVDCPEHAVFVDLHHFVDTNEVLRFHNSLCVFEHNPAVPLRRHHADDKAGSFSFHGGAETHVLVVRTIHTVYNYDYVLDMIFYQNGMIEARVYATGFLLGQFFVEGGKRYGSQVQRDLLGNVHTHLFNFKLDMDLAGSENSFMTVSREFENISHPWSPGRRLIQPWVHRRVVSHEGEAAFRHGTTLPYLVFYNPKKENHWGHSRGFRLQLNSYAQPILPEGYGEEKGVTWSRYQVAVTRYHEIEVVSSNIYIQNNPWEPALDFNQFMRDNETIVEQDLVAWITTGFVHIPSAEDIPNTVTAGNTIGFVFRPFNFFNEDPSLASPDGVVVMPEQEESGEGKSFWVSEKTDRGETQKCFVKME